MNKTDVPERGGREIKFRIWDKVDNEMFKPHPDYLLSCDSFSGEWFVWKNQMGVFRKQGEFILMQSTGLKDKNGVEIFEGDILQVGDGEPHVSNISTVTWDTSEMAGFGLVIPDDGYGKTQWLEFYADETNRYRVIGNIYENPELLEVK